MTYSQSCIDALTEEKKTAIDIFWQTITEHTFLSHDNVKIAYACNLKRPDTPYIIIVPGRSEAYLKYQELIYDFDRLGYDSVIIDHRGQGLSQRLVSNRLQGYVGDFNDYTSDLHQLLSQEIPRLYPYHQQAPVLLAHSMGGAIALRYLQTYESTITAAVLSSPMIAIDSGNIPMGVAKMAIKLGTLLNNVMSNSPWYFFNQSDKNKTTFAENQLTHSLERFQSFSQLYQSNNALPLGGVTFQWLNEAIKANVAIFNHIEKLNLPMLVLQAEEEQIVANSAQNAFCQQLHQINKQACPLNVPTVYKGSFHEIFFEQDQIRSAAITQTIDWFKQYIT